MSSNFPPGYVEEDEPGRWFEDLGTAPYGAQCCQPDCHAVAELMDDDGDTWCADCAGEHDYELRTEIT